MFCPKCGNNLADGMKFCTACGYRISGAGTGTAPQEKSGNQSKPVPENKKKMIPIIAAATVAVIVLAVVLLGKLGNSSSDDTGFETYEDAVNSYITATINKDKDGFVACFEPKQREYIEQDIVRWRKTFETGMPEVSGPYRFLQVYDEWVIKCVVGDTESLTQDELDYFNNNDYGYTVKEGYKVMINVAQSKLDMFGGTITQGREDTPLYVGKIGKKWYVLEPMSHGWTVD